MKDTQPRRQVTMLHQQSLLLILMKLTIEKSLVVHLLGLTIIFLLGVVEPFLSSSASLIVPAQP